MAYRHLNQFFNQVYTPRENKETTRGWREKLNSPLDKTNSPLDKKLD